MSKFGDKTFSLLEFQPLSKSRNIKYSDFFAILTGAGIQILTS
jgi:hypothetical protein